MELEWIGICGEVDEAEGQDRGVCRINKQLICSLDVLWRAKPTLANASDVEFVLLEPFIQSTNHQFIIEETGVNKRGRDIKRYSGRRTQLSGKIKTDGMNELCSKCVC